MSLKARYTILRKIADGGTAEIFLATQHGAHGFEKPVVLKRIFPAFYADPQFRNMLVDEAHIAMSLNHSNIVQVLDLGEADGQYVLALELVDGWTLDAVLRRARALNTEIPPTLALYITAEVCRALAYAHAKTGADGNALGIVHRDASPHNVLLSEQGEVKLTDFGIAKAKNRRESSLGTTIKGKIAFMSPEQASGGELDARSDLFSIGTMLYVTICRRYPFDAPTDLEVLLLVKKGECVPPETARPGLNPEIYRVLKRAMAKAPGDRYQRAEEMLIDVEQVMRVAFRPVGQTELKRWLQDLSIRDGAPPLTRTPAPPSSTPAGRVAGETLELRGIGTTTAPGSVPPPGSVPSGGLPPPTGRSGNEGTPAPRPGPGNKVRPPPPRAAMAVGKKAASPMPHLPAPSILAAQNTPPPVPGTDTPRQPSALLNPEEHPTEKVATPEVIDEHAAERASVKMDVVIPPPSPRKSSSWVAEAVLASAQRTGIAPPPPIVGVIVPPPLPLPVPPVATDVKTEPVPPESPPKKKSRRAMVLAGAGVGLVLLIGLSIRTCDTKSDALRPSDVRRIAEVAAIDAAPLVAPGAVTAPKISPGPDATAAPANPVVSTIAAKEGTSRAEDAGNSLGVAGTSATSTSTSATPDSPDPAVADGGSTKESASAKGAEPDAQVDDEADAGTPAIVQKVAVLIKSSPPGAQVGTSRRPFGSTPVSVKLKVGRTYALVFTREGYRPMTKQFQVTDDPDQQVAANLKRAPPTAAQKAPAAPANPSVPAPPAKTPERNWFQRVFAR
jgi:eukaryotic-like serine/threonine-protein kinase